MSIDIDLRGLYNPLRDQLGPVGHWWPHESRTEQAAEFHGLIVEHGKRGMTPRMEG